MRLHYTSIPFIIGVVLLAGSRQAAAEELRDIYTPVRPVGMGGAFTGVANDENAVWTNPAGVARLRKARSRKPINLITVPNIVMGANTAARSFYSGLRSSDDVAETVASSDVSADKPFWATLSLAPLAFFNAGPVPGGIGFYSNTVTKVVPDTDAPTTAKIDAYSDLGGVFSLAFTTPSNRFSIGTQVRYINRYAVESTVATDSLKDAAVLKDQFLNQANTSSALAVDAGMLLTLADFWFPTLGVSVLNAPLGCRDNYLNPFMKERQTICGTKFVGKFANQEALTTIDPTDIRVGLSITPRLTRTVGLRLAADVHHMAFGYGDNYVGLPGVEPLKMLHVGSELYFGNPLVPSPFSLRLGVNQGFVSFGWTARIEMLALEMAVYGKDISNDESPREDRRILGSLSLEF